ncbi:hypothetical protein F0L74_29060 [Chitinophaga agrisoli]|uniref:Uncharacterized protein n=1 Tax=Chitinophaga agrisoli TaxID=2607653 RepID=A0A5B2VPS0_9BACT|nr:hypothetical protein [Chitinophaga agrisoli]KAA2240217.1 hypothetical protein F0L74_29060 [Chitinophaga agrisoli]
MKAFTIKLNSNRYDVLPLNGHPQRFKVNVNGFDVYYEPDLDGYLRPEVQGGFGANMSLLLDLADRIQETTMHETTLE